MSRPLVVVESPAKAKTLSKFLGSDYDVRASVGHVADLPSKGLTIDVDNGFKPTYELTERGKNVVKDLKAALKDACELYLATDEDREGEAISWHLLEYLKPKVPVKRMVFHEITKAAIDHAVNNPRDLDYGLVDAAETRRILDRLYGYEVSPVLWRRVNRGLSAGRVQSPSVRLIVERERERIAFVTAGYWDIDLTTATQPAFGAKLVAVDGDRVATGKDFDADGPGAAKAVGARRGPGACAGRRSRRAPTFTVRSVEEKPYRSSPKAPFMTSTLQQEGGRKLRLSSSQVMRVAQGLYERGYITYMRTDNVVLSDEAMQATAGGGHERVRRQLSSRRRRSSTRRRSRTRRRPTRRSARPRRYRSPQSLSSELNSQELALYRLIWQRTLASQMADATGVTVSVRLAANSADRSTGELTDCEFAASGTTITFPGYRAVYVGLQGGDRRRRGRERSAAAAAHRRATRCRSPRSTRTATPPRRRPATPRRRWSSGSRSSASAGRRRGRRSSRRSRTAATCGRRARRSCRPGPRSPSSACSRSTSTTLVDYDFTASIDDDLDAIASGRRAKDKWLKRFYFGDTGDGDTQPISAEAGFGEDALPGLKRLVEENLDEIDAAEINTFPLGLDADGELIVVKPGKYGPYVKRGDDTASVPDDLAPDELTVDKAIELLAAPKCDEPIGELDGYPVFAKNGRYGPYVQWGDHDDPPPGFEKPKMSSLFKTMVARADHDRRGRGAAAAARATSATTRPTACRSSPTTAATARTCRRTRTTATSTPRTSCCRSRSTRRCRSSASRRCTSAVAANMAAKGPLREFGTDPVSERPVVAKDGKFGVYVTDGETNASLGKGDRLEAMAPERAYELLAIRREAIIAKGGPTKKRAAKKKAPAKKKAAAKKAPRQEGRCEDAPVISDLNDA